MGSFPQLTPGVTGSQTGVRLGSPFSLTPQISVSAYRIPPCAKCLWKVRQTYIVFGQGKCGHRKVTCHWLGEVLRAHERADLRTSLDGPSVRPSEKGVGSSCDGP